MKKITNRHFLNFKEAVNICCGNQKEDNTIISDMKSASFDSNGEGICFYSKDFINGFINMQAIKLDEISYKRKDMLELIGKVPCDKLPAVDAICIDENNEWFFIEFKNSKVDNKISSIKSKMLSSLWFCLDSYL